MIVERKHVPFWKLKQDDKEAFEIFDKAFNESYLTLNKQEKAISNAFKPFVRRAQNGLVF